MRTCTFILLLSYYSLGFGQDFKIDTLTLNSKILNETREILIISPIDYTDQDSVCLLYLLDGEFAKYRYEKLLEEKNEKAFVGIGIINTNRNRDMLAVKEASQFLDFLEQELIPQIESKFVTKERILFGHSFAGAFTLFSITNKPYLFDKYIASSPLPIKLLIDDVIDHTTYSELKEPVKLFLSYGSKDMKQARKWTEHLVNELRLSKPNKLIWEDAVFEGKNHNNCDIVSLKKGVIF